MPNLIISTIVFIVGMRYANRFFDEWGISKGAMRSLAIFMLAYLLSWGAGELVDKALGTPAVAQTSFDLGSLMKAAGQ